MQYYDTGWIGVLFTTVIVSFILLNIARARKNENLYIRRIAGLNAIDEAIGRSTEMGKPVLMVPGLGDLNAISMQAINIFAYVSRTAARFANPIRLCCANAAVYTLAQEVIRDVYQSEGMIDQFQPDSVQFVSDRQFAFAAGVSGIILREQTAATFFLGEFFAESLIFAETANAIGAIQVAGSTQNTQTPFFIAACDYVLIGDEFYAASAYLTREPVLVGSLIGQDWVKILVGLSIFTGFLANSTDLAFKWQTEEVKDGMKVPLPKPQPKAEEELMMYKLLTPEKPLPGELINKTYSSEDEYLARRPGEIGVASLAPGEKREFVDYEEGMWYSGNLPDGRTIKEFVVNVDNGVVVRRQVLPREKIKPVEAAGGGK